MRLASRQVLQREASVALLEEMDSISSHLRIVGRGRHWRIALDPGRELLKSACFPHFELSSGLLRRRGALPQYF
jgi:hypothetical protein